MIHDIIQEFRFELLVKVTEVNVQNVTISRHVLLLFDLEYSSVMLSPSVKSIDLTPMVRFRNIYDSDSDLT
jgi:hypothetical protein